MTTELPHALAVIVRDGRAALIERVNHGRRYFLFPGGVVGAGESPTEAAARAAREQLGLEVEVVGIAYEEVVAGAVHAYYYADVVGGDPLPEVWLAGGSHDELDRDAGGSYRLAWLPVTHLLAYDVRPYVLARRLDQAAHAV